MVFSAFDVEAILISEMRRLDPRALSWNDSGFGSNDPGRKRDDGEPAPFDRLYPIDIDRPLINIPAGPFSLDALLKVAKESVPYLLRYDAKFDFAPFSVTILKKAPTMRSVVTAVAGALPREFQITVFDGRIIVYPENRTYEFAREVLRGGS